MLFIDVVSCLSVSRYDNHSPPSTTGANGNAANSSGCQDGDHLTPGRNSNGGSDGRGSSPNEANLDDKDERDSNDVRIKCESTTNSFPFEVFFFCLFLFFAFLMKAFLVRGFNFNFQANTIFKMIYFHSKTEPKIYVSRWRTPTSHLR